MKTTQLCKLLRKTQPAPGIFDMTVSFPGTVQPGQFIHINCGDGVLLRRPISICDADGETLRFVFAVRGEGTARLAAFEEGCDLDILGPLGNGFTPVEGEGAPVVVGGGIGVFPLLLLSRHLGRDTRAILGFRTRELVVLEEDFNEVCAGVTVTTDDGSYGRGGLVSAPLGALLEQGGVSAVYACGPTPMLKSVRDLAAAFGVPVQVSLEQRMGCGIGACAVCVCSKNGHYVKTCKEGPVFDGREVDFDD